MNLSKKHEQILNAKICPYCNSITKLVSEEHIYGKSYKNKSMICCSNFPRCDSYVGTHTDGAPLGRLANRELRNAKIKAHNEFDFIWKNKYLNRSEAYEWLSENLNIPKEYTHIGMFSVSTCNKVVEISKKYINDYKRS